MGDRRAAERRGRRSEFAAALALMLKGYAVLERRARTPAGEIDLIARRGRLLAFVEVKARPTFSAAVEAVPPQAWRRIHRASELWLARRPALQASDQRFDLIAVRPWRWPAHLRDAWRPADDRPARF